MLSKLSFLAALYLLFFANTSTAKVLNSGAIKLQSSFYYYEVQATAKCNPPKHEDGAFRVYFSEESYKEVKSYFEESFGMRLINKKCGTNGKGPALSQTDFESVRILFYSSDEAKDLIEETKKSIFNFYGLD